MASNNDGKPKKRRLGTFKLFLIVLILLLIPTTMEQLSMHQETVKTVGRVCVGIAIVFFCYGLFSKVLRFAGLILFALIVVRVLANEGVVEIPNLREKLANERSDRR
jgi:O-antigen ligase